MIEFKINGNRFQLGTPIENFGKINLMELNYPEHMLLQVPLGQGKLIADYLWRVVQSMEDNTMIIVNQIIMYKEDVTEYKGI